MKCESCEAVAFGSYLFFFCAVLGLTLVSLFVSEDGVFVVLFFGLLQTFTIPVMLFFGGFAALGVLLSLVTFKRLTNGYRYITGSTFVYLIGCFLVRKLPWGGESFASTYGPIFTSISIIFSCLGIWVLFSKRFRPVS